MTEQIKHIGIVGGGKMGTSLFSFLSKYDFKITWYIRNEVEKAKKKHQRKLDRTLKNQLISKNEFEQIKQNHRITNSIADLANSNLVIECINENLNAKKDLISELFSLLPSDTIIASNSSSIKPELLSGIAEQKERIIGLHFFFPVEMKNVVELITTKYNSETTINRLNEFLVSIHKFHLIQNHSNVFLLNRLMLHLQAAAFNLHYEKKWSFAQIDSVIDQYFFPIGIFAMMDNIGIDLIYKSALNYLEYEKDKKHFMPLMDYMQKSISNNRLGVKTKCGFFSYINIEDTIPILDKDKKQIATSLANSYFSSYNWIIENNLCSKKDLIFAMNEYLDTDTEKWNDLI